MHLQAIVIGAGIRGHSYADFALQHPDEMKIVAVAEPDDARRRHFAAKYHLSEKQCFRSWAEIAAGEKLADVALNCTMDAMHVPSTLALMSRGYDVLLEKPIAPTLTDTIALTRAAEKAGRLLQICHVLRYAPFWETLRHIVQSGRLGDVISVDHRENLVFWHMAHSYVRGNWRATDTSGPMILTKCCHDFDMLHWILGAPVVWLNSFGELTHFRPEQAPPGATARCLDDCPAADSCKFYAPRLYAQSIDDWPWNAVTFTPSIDARLEALRDGPYGRCVYTCDNDVVDHQTVNMQLSTGTTVTLTMNGHGNEECRTMRYDGTKATLYGRFSARGHAIKIVDHLAGTSEAIPVAARDSSAHGGGDFGVVRSFLSAVQGRPAPHLTTVEESLESHILAFAAEEARRTHQVIYLPEFRAAAQG